MRNVIWSPGILNVIVQCFINNKTPEETWKEIQSNANSHDLNRFKTHFSKKAKKKEVNEEDLIVRRIKNEMNSAKQILPLGSDALNQWINNEGNARTYAWRRQKKKELLNEQ